MSPGVIPFPRSNRMGDNEAQLDKAGQTILQLLNKAANVAEQNSRHAIDTAQRRHASLALPKLELPASRPRDTGSKPSALNRGSIASTRKLRSSFSGNVMIIAKAHDDRRVVQIGANAGFAVECVGNQTRLSAFNTRFTGGWERRRSFPIEEAPRLSAGGCERGASIFLIGGRTCCTQIGC
jgi:hypothetical protein